MSAVVPLGRGRATGYGLGPPPGGFLALRRAVRQRLVLAACVWIVLSLAYLASADGNGRSERVQPIAAIGQSATGPVATVDYAAIVREIMLADGSIRHCR